jgi:biopolymer transport protein ExbD
MAFDGGGSRGIKNDINVTPLVDVVLVLLIIFMVVTPLLQRGKDVHLPRARTTDASKMPDALVISIPADQSIWVETTRVEPAGLRARLVGALAKQPDRKILIKGDESLKVRDVRAVMADAKSAGARGVSLAVELVKP